MRRLSGSTNPTPETPGDLLRPAFQDFNQGSLATPSRVRPGHPHRRPVAVHQLAHLPVWQEHVLAAVLGQQETEAVPVPAHRADHQRQPVEEAVLLGAIEQQLPVPHHCAEPLRERLPEGTVADAQSTAERIEIERLAGLAELLEDELPARHGVVVAAGLLPESGIPVLPT